MIKLWFRKQVMIYDTEWQKEGCCYSADNRKFCAGIFLIQEFCE